MRRSAIIALLIFSSACEAALEEPLDGGTAADSGASQDAQVADLGPVPSSSKALTMSEVSILFPLPTASEVDALLGASAVGVGGELVPRALYDRAQPLLITSTPEEVYGELRVVAARIDPCFGLSNRPCRQQLRLVLQPVGNDGAGLFGAKDAALHAIYELPEADFDRFVARLRALGEGAPELLASGPLDVHPVMKREGLRGAYATGLRAAILEAAGKERLARLTFMRLSGRANIWIFGGLDRRGPDDYVATVINGVAPETQRIEHNVFGDELALTLQPSVADADDFSLLFDSDDIRAASASDRRRALAAALRAENPTMHDPESIDCARCHVAGVVRQWTERVMGDQTAGLEDRYQSESYDLATIQSIPPPKAQTTFRAFGWQQTEPAISPRTINETAEVLRQLE